MHTQPPRRTALAFAALLPALAALQPGAALAGETTTPAAKPTAPATATERCLTIHTIKQTKIIDDDTVVFYTNGGRYYRNRLPHTCSGLKVADSFAYRTSQTQLCSVDIITVLNRMGSDLSRGPSCGLGEFEEISKKQLDELTGKTAKAP